jgi:hypothetical protein
MTLETKDDEAREGFMNYGVLYCGGMLAIFGHENKNISMSENGQ